jgi:sodium/pantothenate symporter
VVAFIFGYMMFGGANSMVYTNAVQAVLMVVVSFILLGSGYEHFSQGVHGFLDRLGAIDPALAAWTNPESFFYRDAFEIVVCQLVIGAAVVCQPHIITRALFLKTDRDVNIYLVVVSAVLVVLFLVVTTGLYARLEFPDLAVNGVALKTDGIMSAYVVREFPVLVGIFVVLGLIAAGISTLEGLIQSVSTTLTSDVIEPLFSRWMPVDPARRARHMVKVNCLVITLLGIAAIGISANELFNPSQFSVAVLAQNGVYAYFAAAFVPILFGIFIRDVPRVVPIAASVTAILVHFAIYYGGLTHYMQALVKNPAIPATIAIMASLVVGAAVLMAVRIARSVRQERVVSQPAEDGV